jgi:hypothetical protein
MPGSDVVKTANTTQQAEQATLLILRFSLFRAQKLWSFWVPLQLPKAPIVYHDVRRELYLRWDPVCTTTCMQAPASRRRAVSSGREGTLVHTVLIAWYRSVPVRTRVMFTTLWRGLDFDDADSMGHPP